VTLARFQLIHKSFYNDTILYYDDTILHNKIVSKLKKNHSDNFEKKDCTREKKPLNFKFVGSLIMCLILFEGLNFNKVSNILS